MEKGRRLQFEEDLLHIERVEIWGWRTNIGKRETKKFATVPRWRGEISVNNYQTRDGSKRTGDRLRYGH